MSAEPLFRDYLTRIEQAHRAGNATEHTYRTYLQTLLEALLPHITATNEPKRVACGAPDYVISTATRIGPATIGYVEAKDIGVPLTDTLKTDQLDRYRRALENLVLTDYLEFRWFLKGEHHMTVRLAEVKNGRIIADRDGWQGRGSVDLIPRTKPRTHSQPQRPCPAHGPADPYDPRSDGGVLRGGRCLHDAHRAV